MAREEGTALKGARGRPGRRERPRRRGGKGDPGEARKRGTRPGTPPEGGVWGRSPPLPPPPAPFPGPPPAPLLTSPRHFACSCSSPFSAPHSRPQSPPPSLVVEGAGRSKASGGCGRPGPLRAREAPLPHSGWGTGEAGRCGTPWVAMETEEGLALPGVLRPCGCPQAGWPAGAAEPTPGEASGAGGRARFLPGHLCPALLLRAGAKGRRSEGRAKLGGDISRKKGQ